MTSQLFNSKALRKLILRRANELRTEREWTRVDGGAEYSLEIWLRMKIDAELRSMPSIGKTIRFE